MTESNNLVKNLVKSLGSGISEADLNKKNQNSFIKEGLGLLAHGLTAHKNEENNNANEQSETNPNESEKQVSSEKIEVESDSNLENNQESKKSEVESIHTPEKNEKPIEENSTSFFNKIILVKGSDEFLDLTGKEGCLVQYTAKWCVPSKRIAPVLSEMAVSNPNVKFLEVDIDECRRTSRDLVSHITNVPFFELYLNGEKIDEFFGDNLSKIKKGVSTLAKK